MFLQCVSGKKRTGITLGLCLALALAIAWDVCLLVRQEEPFPEPPPYDFDAPRYLLPQPPTTAFPIETVREAWDRLRPDELVLGITVNAESRAYPLNVLNLDPSYKVLNDTLGGRPIAATFCDNCHNGIVYLREIDGQTLTFGVDGRLWKESMVLYDQETHSRWSHITGVGKIGRLQGKALTVLPSVMTDWRTWRHQQSEGTVVVLPHTGQEFVRGYYADLKEFVLGVAGGGQYKSWSLDNLRRTPVINDEWQGAPVLAVLDQESVTARLFSRRLSARVLTFRDDQGKMIDEETGSSWERTSGRALCGPLQGQTLPVIAGAMLSKREAWRLHFPEP